MSITTYNKYLTPRFLEDDSPISASFAARYYL